NEKKEIIISNKGETTLAGMFAAGDSANSAYKQIVIAAGQGAAAALGAYEYIQLKEGNVQKVTK
ncbi:MAG TPA: hypothetical protein VMD74_05285, partial [Candidatus Methylomirabilis sp.]|nr:hypothetical protein [Candidatus Methylomirabilis sp.]